MILWRRHAPPCDSVDRMDPRCGCPIYAEYRVNNKRFRRTLKTSNWQKALADARKKEMDGFQEKPKSPTIEQACEKYLLDAKARELREPTLYSFRLLFRQLQEFAQDRGLVFVSDFDLDMLRDFRATWPNKNESARVKLGRFQSFFRFCVKSKWVEENYAADLKPPKVIDVKIEPLEPAEFEKILEACDKVSRNRKALKAVVLLLRYTGLRIRDVVTLPRDAVRNSKLFLRTAKTGTDVWCPLPPGVLEALQALPVKGKYYFWSGTSKPKSAVGNYQHALSLLFEKAGVPRAYPHLFRHTFATDLLQKGASLQTVAVLLGHSSTRITERRYSHWIKARQESLESEVKKSWAQTGTVATQSSENRLKAL
jgi:integrase/recombinase XerD